MVAGGIGQTPFLLVGKEALQMESYGQPPRSGQAARSVTFCFGARTAESLVGVEEFQQCGIPVHLATDDGSRGVPGLVTELLPQVLDQIEPPIQIVCCGPRDMMRGVAQIARRRQLPCLVSLETPMACGIGICFSCVAKVQRPDQSWDWRRTCVDGPVLPADQIVWD
jgi:dihydroorotate dehydrogenase electron transfer subunit